MALDTSGISDPGYNRRRNIVTVIASGSMELTARRHDTSVGPKKIALRIGLSALVDYL